MITSSLYLSLRSILNRKLTTSLAISSIAMSVMLLLGVERIRRGAKDSFESTLSGTDLIVGARSGPVQLLLYSVFHLGNPMNNITWESYQDIIQQEEIAWTIPLSLGDSHKGFRVVGTTGDFFRHYHYGRKRSLTFFSGKAFSQLYDVVVGYEVARRLAYKVGDKLVLSHGLGAVSFQDHKDKPFTLVGILEKTGTPIDRALHVSLEAIEAIHMGWENGAPPIPGSSKQETPKDSVQLKPQEITAFLIGLRSKLGIFQIQRSINDYDEESLLAILPGVTFAELWSTLGTADQALWVISLFVVFATILGMIALVLTTLDERRREMAILRSLGARPRDIFILFLSEGFFLTAGGCCLGFAGIYVLLWISQPLIENQFGIFIPLQSPSLSDFYLMGIVMVTGLMAATMPALGAFRQSLADGLSMRI